MELYIISVLENTCWKACRFLGDILIWITLYIRYTQITVRTIHNGLLHYNTSINTTFKKKHLGLFVTLVFLAYYIPIPTIGFTNWYIPLWIFLVSTLYQINAKVTFNVLSSVKEYKPLKFFSLLPVPISPQLV